MLSLEFGRDCWELGYTKQVRSSELHVARSRLTITPVSEIRWEVATPHMLSQELWVESIYLGSSFWEVSDASELVISAPHSGWKLTISIASHFGKVRLVDLETPYLFSMKNGEVGTSHELPIKAKK